MKIGIIGRSEWTYDSMTLLKESGHQITFIVTAKEAPEYKYTSKDFQKFARANNIPFLHDTSITVDKLLNLISDLQTEICISVNYSGIIAENIISLFPLGILNAHGGDLPKYRGNACQAWAIINREDRIGLCIHKMVGGELDSGDIIERSYMDIDINSNIGKIYNWMEQEIPVLILNSVEKLEKEPEYILETQSKNPREVLRTYPRNPDDGKIDWNKDGESIIRLINASSEPFSGAFTSYNSDKLIIWRAALFTDNENYSSATGQIAKINKDSGNIIVITGKGKIEITEIEVNGERTKPAVAIKSIRVRLK